MTATRGLLVSWIGHADLLAMIDEIGDPGDEIRKAAKIQARLVEKPGPLKTALIEGKFEKVQLLSNYPEAVNEPFARWLGCIPKIHCVDLKDPTDYQGIFRCANQVLSEITKNGTKDGKINILLSPGTPAMAVVWVLLGKSRYPAKFYQTAKGKLHEANMPPDLFEEMVPILLRDRDIAFQHLASCSPSEVPGFENLYGTSAPLRLAVGRSQRAAIRNVSVLLSGETGTGKDLFAQAIHKASNRKGKFEAINCAAIPKDLLESELFGVTKGAFTGATHDRDGAFSRANGGTLFLDEIGECDPLLQAKLLRVLQPPPDKKSTHREFRKVGGSNLLVSDVRIIAATNLDLIKQIKANRFREDLYYRIATINIKLPPLRDRPSDIPILAEQFLKLINKELKETEPGYKDKIFSPQVKDFVKKYSWPGNVRQLHNAIQQAAIMTASDTISRQDILEAIGDIDEDISFNILERPLGDGFCLEDLLEEVQSHYLNRAMIESNCKKTLAAELLGLASYQTLDSQLKNRISKFPTKFDPSVIKKILKES